MSKVIPSTTFGHVPDSTLSVESKIFDLKLKLENSENFIFSLQPTYLDIKN